MSRPVEIWAQKIADYATDRYPAEGSLARLVMDAVANIPLPDYIPATCAPCERCDGSGAAGTRIVDSGKNWASNCDKCNGTGKAKCSEQKCVECRVAAEREAVDSMLPTTGAWSSRCPSCGVFVQSGDLKHLAQCKVGTAIRARSGS